MVMLEYDPEADAIYATIRVVQPGETRAARSLDDRRLIHYDHADMVVGVEFLEVSGGLDLADLPYADDIAAALKAFQNIQPAA